MREDTVPWRPCAPGPSRTTFKELIARGDRFVLDPSGVSFCDSAGLNVLLGAWRQADAGGAMVVLARVPEPLLRILQMTGADQLLRVHGTVTDAEAVFAGIRSRDR
ncbi:STAS domain-containing protein [Streptomyces canus]|uniref:STAS domain-containing protein n=1 Tax=Streptomyces canus TaxID=58343 RepID=UPI0037117517